VEDDGLFKHEISDEWIEESPSYFIKVDSKLAGFVLLSAGDGGDRHTKWSINEFFIMPKYRRSGIGKYVYFKVLDEYKGDWQVVFHPKNKAASHFWANATDEYTNGNYEYVKSHSHRDYVYCDGSQADVIYFDNF